MNYEKAIERIEDRIPLLKDEGFSERFPYASQVADYFSCLRSFGVPHPCFRDSDIETASDLVRKLDEGDECAVAYYQRGVEFLEARDAGRAD